MNTVYLELYREALYVEAPGEVANYTDTFEELARIALSSTDTAELIGTMIREK